MCEVVDVYAKAKSEAEELHGVWKVVSNKDNRDRQLEVMNQPNNPSLLWIIRGADGIAQRVAVLPEDARQFCIGVLHLLDGEMPIVNDAWSPNEASIGPVD